MEIIDTEKTISIRQTDLKEIYIKNVVGEKIVFQALNNKLTIDKSELANLDLIEKKQITFYNNEDDSLIVIDNNSSINNYSKQPNLKNDSQFVTIYVDNEGILSLMKNHIPSNSLFFRNESNITNITVENTNLIIDFEFYTKRFAAEKVYGFILLRGSKNSERAIINSQF